MYEIVSIHKIIKKRQTNKERLQEYAQNYYSSFSENKKMKKKELKKNTIERKTMEYGKICKSMEIITLEIFNTF